MLDYLTYWEYEQITKNAPYWHEHGERWDYLSLAIEWMRDANASSLLELGAAGLRLAKQSVLMDCSEKLYEKDIKHNANDIPWPFENKQFDFFVALQVFEHLDIERRNQRNVFKEADRIASNIIISVPYQWRKSDEMHNGIDDSVVMSWTGREPEKTRLVDGNRKLYFFRACKSV